MVMELIVQSFELLISFSFAHIFIYIQQKDDKMSHKYSENKMITMSDTICIYHFTQITLFSKSLSNYQEITEHSSLFSIRENYMLETSQCV
jgi:hypothetical protein